MSFSLSPWKKSESFYNRVIKLTLTLLLCLLSLPEISKSSELSWKNTSKQEKYLEASSYSKNIISESVQQPWETIWLSSRSLNSYISHTIQLGDCPLPKDSEHLWIISWMRPQNIYSKKKTFNLHDLISSNFLTSSTVSLLNWQKILAK